eukprot:c37436_g1_i1 orf=57-1688(+)
MMTQELPLKSGCGSCGATFDIYGSQCRHMSLCKPCGKSMAEKATPCPDCGTPVTRLIREYNVKAHPLNKPHFVARFLQGVPSFVKKKGNDSKWTMQREGLQGRQLTEALREKYKGKPWLLNDDQGQQSFQGVLEGGQQASYYLLMMHGKDFLAMPAGAWYNFHKVANYKQLTLEEAEEQMKNRRKTADGYQRWLMKAAITGAAAFGEVEKISGGGGGGRGGFKRRADDDDDDPAFSDKGEEDADDEEDRKNRLGMNKKNGDEDGEEPAKGDDREFEDEEPERGDDWEHEETFTDDDETVGNDPEEREENAPELSAPPEIKQEEEDEEAEQEDGQQEKGGLSESGLELKKLLGKTAGLDESADDESSDEDNDMENEDNSSPVLAPKRKEVPKEEPGDSTPAKPANAAPGRTTPANTAVSKGKRKAGTDDSKSSPAAASSKKVKTEASQEDIKSSESAPKAGVSPAKAGAAPSRPKSTSQGSGVVTEDDVKAVLKQGPIKSHDLVNKFKSRLATREDKAAFASVLKNISRIHKTDAGNFIVLREK